MRSLFFLLPVVLLTFFGSAAAQAPTGAIAGQVVDATGAALAGAVVHATRGVSTARAGDTDGTGRFRLAGLEPGVWHLRVEHPGFRPVGRATDVHIGSDTELAVTMTLAGFTTSVTLEARESALEPRRTDVSQIVDRGALDQLAVQGRNFVDIAKLDSHVAPGRENVGGGAFKEPDSAIGPAAAPRLSFNGQSELHTGLLVDGLEATQTFTGLPRATPSIEAVEQFRVLSTTYSAEYGRALGGFVNIVTRSGGERTRGTAAYAFSGGPLAAQSALASRPDEVLRGHQFGGTIGGPLGGGNVTAFGSYEGQRRTESNRYSRVILDNVETLNRVRTSFGLTPETLDQLRGTDYDQALMRVDRRRGGWSTGARYSGLGSKTSNFPGGGGRASPASSAARNNEVADHTVVGTVTGVLSRNALVDVRAQWADRRFEYPSVLNEPALEISNLIIMGKTTSDMDFYRERRWQVAGSVEVARGAHLIKAGGTAHWVQDQSRWELFFPARIIFPGLTAFSTFTPAVFWWPNLTTVDAPHPGNDPTWASAVPPAWDADANFQIDHRAAGAFVQDQWSISNTLTATIGVRYDIDTFPSAYLATRDLNNIQPRVGMTWRVRLETIVRGGYGIFGDRLAPSVGQMFNTTEWNSRGHLAGATTLFGDVAPVQGRFSPLTVRGPLARPAALTFLATGRVPPASAATPSLADNLDSRLRNPYSHHASVQVEQAVGRLTLAATAVRVAARNLPAHTPNVNAVETSVLPSGKPRLGGRLIPELGDFFVQTNLGESTHHALTLEARRRPVLGMGFGASYTWGKTLANADSLANVADFPAGTDIALERALSRQHVAHRFTAQATGITPLPLGPLRALTLSAIVTADSGRPFTIFAGSDVNGDGNPNSDRAGLLARGTLDGPAYASLDLRLGWPLRWRNRVWGDVRADLFNAFNRTNVRDLNTVWGSDDLSRQPDAALGFNTPRDVFNARQLELGVRLTF